MMTATAFLAHGGFVYASVVQAVCLCAGVLLTVVRWRALRRISAAMLIALLSATPAMAFAARTQAAAFTLADEAFIAADEGDGGAVVACPNLGNLSEFERWLCIASMFAICDCYGMMQG